MRQDLSGLTIDKDYIVEFYWAIGQVPAGGNCQLEIYVGGENVGHRDTSNFPGVTDYILFRTSWSCWTETPWIGVYLTCFGSNGDFGQIELDDFNIWVDDEKAPCPVTPTPTPSPDPGTNPDPVDCTNLIVHGDLEGNDPWETEIATGNTWREDRAQLEEHSHSPSKFVGISVQQDSYEVLHSYMPITLQSTKQYVFSFWWAAGEAYSPNACIMTSSINDGQIGQHLLSETATAYEYQKLSFPFTGLDHVETIDIKVSCTVIDTVDMFFDDFSLVEAGCDTTTTPGDPGTGGGSTPSGETENFGFEDLDTGSHVWYGDDITIETQSGQPGQPVAHSGTHYL